KICRRSVAVLLLSSVGSLAQKGRRVNRGILFRAAARRFAGKAGCSHFPARSVSDRLLLAGSACLVSADSRPNGLPISRLKIPLLRTKEIVDVALSSRPSLPAGFASVPAPVFLPLPLCVNCLRLYPLGGQTALP